MRSASPATRASASRLTVERDWPAQPTGWLTGDNRAISDLFDLLPRPTFAQKVEGTRAFFRALNAMGITGVIDPGGYNLAIAEYQRVFQIWREHGLTLRVRYSLCAPRRGHELEDFKELTQMLPMGSGDDWLRFNGIGENVTWGMYNNDTPTEAQKEQLYRGAALGGVARHDRDIPLAQRPRPCITCSTCWSASTRETPIAKLRWSVAHLNDASPAASSASRRWASAG